MASGKRLIDAVALADEVFTITFYATGMRNGKTLLKELLEKYRNEVLRKICKAPTVDAVEVVRCRDCVNYCGFEHCKNGICDVDSVSKRAVCPDDFCSYGERREGE